MKNAMHVLAVAAVCALVVSCGSSPIEYAQPGFDKPLGYVIDAYAVDGKMEDNVKIHNKSTDSDIYFNIYVHDPDSREWILYGKGDLKGPNDTDTIDAGAGINDLDDYRYFAVESLNDKEYSYRVYKKNNDLQIDIMDK